MMAMQELVVPKSIPKIFAISDHPSRIQTALNPIPQDVYLELFMAMP
jgi:hypothetical protein